MSALITTQAAELARLRGLLDEAAEAERAAIVAWLRGEYEFHASMRDGGQAVAYSFAADAIAAGEHLAKGGEG